MAATVGHVSLWQRGTDLITTSLPKLSKGPFPSGRLPHGIYHFFMVYTSTIVVHDDIHVVYNDIYIWKVASWYIPLLDGIYHEAIGIYHMVYTIWYIPWYIPWYISLKSDI
jgi:hypothetical protein